MQLVANGYIVSNIKQMGQLTIIRVDLLLKVTISKKILISLIFFPVAKIVTIKVLLSLTASCGWPLVQMDINNGFLNDDLFEEVYMSLPLGYYIDCKSFSSAPLVYKLNSRYMV